MNPRKADDVSWGKEVGGLQAGVVGTGPVRIGETARFAIKLRNVGKAEIKVAVWPLWLHTPGVVDVAGKRVRGVAPPVPLFEFTPVAHTLQPGQTIDLGKADIAVTAAEVPDRPDPTVKTFTIKVTPAKYKASFGGFVQGRPGLLTGGAEFEVREPAAPAALDKDLEDLQGEWTVREMEGDGEEVFIGKLEGMKWSIKGNEITASQPGVTGKMSFKLDPKKTPKEIDLTALDGKLKETTSPGIYEIDGRKLRVCFGDKVRPTKFATALDDGRTMLTLEKAAVTTWGKEIGGLQAGLSVGGRRVYRHGETVKVVLKVRNAGKDEVEFKHIWAFFVENPPTIADADGKRVQLPRGAAEGAQRPRDTKVAPGKEVDLYTWEFDLRVKGERSPGNTTIHGTGTFSVQCERVVGPTSGNLNHPNPAMDKLATGKLEIEVTDAKTQPFTAWGKEIGGLQAGLEVKEKRVYRLGEAVTLLVRVRNVGKQAVKFEYIRQYLDENPPDVTGADGKGIPQGKSGVTGLAHVPVAVNLDPGKEVVLETRIHRANGVPYELCPANRKAATQGPSLDVGTGKVSLRYERVFGNSSIGRIKIDPDLAELATGRLEIEVVDPQAPFRFDPEPDVQEVSDPLPIVRGPLQKDGARAIKTRKDVVGKPVRVEGIAWGQPFGLKGQEGTISPHAGPHVMYEGGSVFVRGIDFTETKARGKPVRVTGTLRFEPGTATRWGDIKGYYYIEATKFEVIDAVADPHLVYLEK